MKRASRKIKKLSLQDKKRDSLFRTAIIDKKIRFLLRHEPDEVFIRVNRIYAQIAKYSGNHEREREIVLLTNALDTLERKKWLENLRYVKMKRKDAIQCFGGNPPTMKTPTVLRIASPVLIGE